MNINCFKYFELDKGIDTNTHAYTHTLTLFNSYFVDSSFAVAVIVSVVVVSVCLSLSLCQRSCFIVARWQANRTCSSFSSSSSCITLICLPQSSSTATATSAAAAGTIFGAFCVRHSAMSTSISLQRRLHNVCSFNLFVVFAVFFALHLRNPIGKHTLPLPISFKVQRALKRGLWERAQLIRLIHSLVCALCGSLSLCFC